VTVCLFCTLEILLLTYLLTHSLINEWNFRNYDGLSIQTTSAGTHAQIKGRQHAGNYGLDWRSVGKMGAWTGPAHPGFC